MENAVTPEHEFRPRLTARREAAHSYDASLLKPITARLNRRALQLHFDRTARRPSIRPHAEPSPSRRVATKAFTVVHGPGARIALGAHLRYIEREGAGPHGETVTLFDRDGETVQKRGFADLCRDDPHHYRLTINPEDGRELPDQKAFCRSLMASVEEDLGARLDWVAGAHHDTGRPHLHIVVRGLRGDGASLKIPRDYLAHGLRERAESLATELLGPREERAQPHILALDRFTRLDRLIIDSASEGRLDARGLPELSRSDALRRLAHLERRGWVHRQAAHAWSIPSNLRATLHRAKERGAREKAAARVLGLSGLPIPAANLQAYEASDGDRVIGGYVGRRFIGPYAGGAEVVVLQNADGAALHVRMPDTASAVCLDQLPPGAIIELEGVPRVDRASDVAIAEIALQNDGVWSAEAHAALRPGDSRAFIERHLKRAAAMCRDGVCTPGEGGAFRIPRDYVSRAREMDVMRWGPATPSLRVLDPRSLEEQVRAPGLTWLDKSLRADGVIPSLSGAFGEEVRSALHARRSVLAERGLLSGPGERLGAEAYRKLGLEDIRGAFEALRSGGKTVFFARPGDAVRGRYSGRVFLTGIPHAAIESAGAITLTPWKPGLEACRGKALAGMVTNEGLDFRTVRALGLDLGLG